MRRRRPCRSGTECARCREKEKRRRCIARHQEPGLIYVTRVPQSCPFGRDRSATGGRLGASDSSSLPSRSGRRPVHREGKRSGTRSCQMNVSESGNVVTRKNRSAEYRIEVNLSSPSRRCAHDSNQRSIARDPMAYLQAQLSTQTTIAHRRLEIGGQRCQMMSPEPQTSHSPRRWVH